MNAAAATTATARIRRTISASLGGRPAAAIHPPTNKTTTDARALSFTSARISTGQPALLLLPQRERDVAARHVVGQRVGILQRTHATCAVRIRRNDQVLLALRFVHHRHTTRTARERGRAGPQH